jgi:rod shape-determining protein MreC
VLLLLVLIALTFVTFDARSGGHGVLGKVRTEARNAANPVQQAVHSALQPIGDFLWGAIHYKQMEQENQRLRQEVVADQAKQIAAAEEQAQAQQVLAQEHLDFVGNIPSVAAQVIDLGAANFEETIEINRGSASGIIVGQPVVAAGGLVGSVAEVSRGRATITLLDDPQFAVGVRVDQNGDTGAADGQGAGNTLRVADINVGVPVKKGQTLVTSGLQLEHFPPGIPVGTVTSASTPAGSLQQEVTLTPLVNLSNLQFVQVLLWSAQSG